MNETERKVYLEQFNRRTHVLGRAVCVITLVLLVGAPFLIGTFLGRDARHGAPSARAFCPSALCGRSQAWRSFSSTRPCSARAAATSPSSPATLST